MFLSYKVIIIVIKIDSGNYIIQYVFKKNENPSFAKCLKF